MRVCSAKRCRVVTTLAVVKLVVFYLVFYYPHGTMSAVSDVVETAVHGTAEAQKAQSVIPPPTQSKDLKAHIHTT